MWCAGCPLNHPRKLDTFLKQCDLSEKDAQNRTRLQALWQLRRGRTLAEVAKLVDKHPRIIQDWVAWYRQRGSAEVLRRRHGGHGSRQSWLTGKQMDGENMKGESIAPVVQQWAEYGVEAVVWDRARGHRGPAYHKVAVKLIEQPPSSPELNPAERVLEYLRSKIEGQV